MQVHTQRAYYTRARVQAFHAHCMVNAGVADADKRAANNDVDDEKYARGLRCKAYGWVVVGFLCCPPTVPRKEQRCRDVECTGNYSNKVFSGMLVHYTGNMCIGIALHISLYSPQESARLVSQRRQCADKGGICCTIMYK